MDVRWNEATGTYDWAHIELLFGTDSIPRRLIALQRHERECSLEDIKA